MSGDGGFDTLTGGGGADEFIMQSSGADRDLITDFQPGVDKLRLPDGVAFTDLQIRDAAGNTEMVRNGEVLAILNGVVASSVTTNDFIGVVPEPEPTPIGDPLPPPGSTLAAATDLGVLTEAGLSLQDFVGDGDPNDYYRFTLPSNGRFSTTLGAVTESARVQLIKDFNNNGMIDEGDDDILTSSLANSSNNASLSRALPVGTYYVRVQATTGFRSTNTNYNLSISVT